MATAKPSGRIKRRGSLTRKTVSPDRIERIVAEVSREFGVRADNIRNMRQRHGLGERNQIAAARWEAWRRLTSADTSIASLARRWPCHHTTILNALNKLEKAAA